MVCPSETGRNGLQFYEDASAVEHVSYCVVYGNEDRGVCQRRPFVGCYGCVEHGVYGVVQCELLEQYGEQFACHVECQCVHAEDAAHVKRPPEDVEAPVFVFEVDDEHDESLRERRQSAADEHVRRAPYAFVQRQSVCEQIADDDAHRADDEQVHRLMLHRWRLLYQSSAVEAYQHVSHAADGAEESFGVDGALVVQVVVAEEPEVCLSNDVR